jgi:hypothetical protein
MISPSRRRLDLVFGVGTDWRALLSLSVRPFFFRSRDGLDLLTFVNDWSLDELVCGDWIFWGFNIGRENSGLIRKGQLARLERCNDSPSS